MKVKSSNSLDHVKQFFFILGSKEILLVIVLEGNAVGNFEDSLRDFFEEFPLEEVELECLFDQRGHK